MCTYVNIFEVETGAFHADFLSSSASPGLQAHERLDPFWDRLWDSGSSLTWRSWTSMTAQADAGLGSVPTAHQLSEPEAWEVLTSPRRFKEVLRLLACLHTFRTMTAEQAAAASGCPAAAKVRSPIISALFRLEVIEIGSAAAGLTRTHATDRAVMYRLGRGKAVDRLIGDLTWVEWLSITGGQPWRPGGQYDRHNALATELGLRIAEYTDVAAVLGESLSTIDLLAGSGIGSQSLSGDTRSADLCIVRSDGLKIAVEVTASTGHTFTSKVERWAKLLNDVPLSRSGLVVLFLTAPAAGGPPGALVGTVRKEVARVVRRYPGTASETIGQKIFVATWPQWNPGRHLLTDSLVTMTADAAAGMRDGAMTWKPVEILNQRALPYQPATAGLTAILDNCHLLWGMPHWLRDHHQAPDMTPLVVPADIPYARPARPGRTKGHEPGTPKGAVGRTTVPKRLLPYM